MNRRQFFKSFGLVGAVVGVAIIPKDILKAAEPKIEFKEVEFVYPGQVFKASDMNKTVEAIKQLQDEVKKLK